MTLAARSTKAQRAGYSRGPRFRDPVLEDASLGLLRADLLVPDAERFDLRLRLERLRVRKILEPRLVLGTAVLLDRV